nr:sodium:solute symporter [Actinoplanes lutulentus]
MAVVVVLGFGAARWRASEDPQTLEEWGVGGRSFGNWVTWFLIGGSMYSAYTFIAVPALTYGVGAIGYFAVPFAIVTTPLTFLFTTRAWSVARRHGFVTHSEFASARFGSPGLGAAVAVTGILATMPYVAVQLLALQAVLRTVGFGGEWPMLAAVAVVSICTFRSGLRAPALLSVVKDILMAWMLLTAVLMVAMYGGWDRTFRVAGEHFAATPSPADGLLLPQVGHLGFLTLVIGSALAVFAYPHALVGMLAAKDRATVRRNAAALPVYCIALALMALLGFFALSRGVTPVDGDLNTVIPRLIHEYFPSWSAGIAYAGLSVAALIPAAVMSIAAANAFTRSLFRPYLRPDATPATEARVSRWVSLIVKFGAAALILAVDPAYSVELQLIGGVVILQTIPAVFIGLLTGWFHRVGLIAGLLAGLGVGVGMLYDIPRADGTGHFGGSSWSVSFLGFGPGTTVYVGVVALAVNLVVAVGLTLVLRASGVAAGVDATHPDDYLADAGDAKLKRLDGLIDGLPRKPLSVDGRGAHTAGAVRTREAEPALRSGSAAPESLSQSGPGPGSGSGSVPSVPVPRDAEGFPRELGAFSREASSFSRDSSWLPPDSGWPPRGGSGRPPGDEPDDIRATTTR